MEAIQLMVSPSNPLERVRQLALLIEHCDFYPSVLSTLRNHGLDVDDLLNMISSDLGDVHCFKTAPTKKYHPETTSDYYSMWVEECRNYMFLKLFVRMSEKGEEILTITSFKKDDRYGL